MRRPSTLVLVAAAAALAAASTGGCARQRRPPNVLLVVIDTLRADHVGPQGELPSLTPNLDAFAAECVVFDHAQSPRAKTTPSVATLLSGLYPHDHGVRDLTTPLADDVPVLAEALAGSGYRTGAIVGNYVLQDQLSGLARGFDLWVEDLPDEGGVPPHDVPLRGADSLTDGVLCALDLGPPSADGAGPERPLVRGKSPWFLYAHYMDPHGAYEPPEPHRAAAIARAGDAIERVPPPSADPVHPQWVADYNVPPEARLADGGIDANRVRALYAGEVRHVDEQLGRLFDALRAAGTLEDTVVVVTADHGESLGEHDYWFEHGRHAYEATCRVPLLVRFPDSMEERPVPGLRSGDIALADVVPTLTELLRLPRTRGTGRTLGPVRGRSRAGLVMVGEELDEPVFCEKVERSEKARAVQAKAVRLGDWKLIRRYTHVATPGPGGEEERQLIVLSEELYDLASDPREERDLSDAPPPDAPLAALSRGLLRFSTADEHFAELARLLQQKREQLGREDPEILRALRALGY